MPYVNSNGVDIYYETYGQGVPIVFLHPLYTNGYIWCFQIFPFARTNQCVVIDHRGHGRSGKPQQGYSIREHTEDVAAVLDELQIDRAVLVGNAIGGMIAMQFSLDYPERVLGNVIISTGMGLSQDMPADALVDQGAFTRLIDLTVSAKTRQQRGEILDLMKALVIVESNFPRYVFVASSQDPEGVFNWNIKDRLKDIHNPTLVLVGAEDQATPVEMLRVVADGIPGAQLNVIKDVGHFYQLENPSEFNETLRQFVDQVAG